MKLFFLLPLILTLSTADTVHYELTASWYNPDISPDGFERPILGFNKQFPGPTIEAHIGDQVIIKVNNDFDQPFSVHWHGIFQLNQNEQDGAIYITQCPILPGHSQVYNFSINGQTGTYWYHSHSENQYVNGLRGAFIVYPKSKEPYEYFEEKIVQLGDWYHASADKLFAGFDEPQSQGKEPVPDNVLINGFGQGYCDGECRYSLFEVNNSKPTRFRIINNSAFAVIYFSIDEHPLFIIEADGNDVIFPGTSLNKINEGEEKSSVNQIRLNVGQRYSVLVFPNKNDQKSYWIRAVMDDSVFATPSPHNISLGIVSYGKPSIPRSKFIAGNTLSSKPCSTCVDCNDLIPLEVRNPPLKFRTIKLDISFYANDQGVVVAHFNNKTCVFPQTTSYLNLVRAGAEHFPTPCSYQWVDYGEAIRVVINNYDTGEHPIHLHGYKFWILDEAIPGAGPFQRANETNLNYRNPLYRDTATVNAQSYLVLEFIADNPGEWILHCHINWHMMVGLVSIFSVAPEQTVERLGATDSVLLC